MFKIIVLTSLTCENCLFFVTDNVNNTVYTSYYHLKVGLDKLCQHNFENNRYSQEYENNAGIIGKAFCVIIT